MKPLALAVFFLIGCPSLRAQPRSEASDALEALKKKYGKGGQKPSASAAETAPQPQDGGLAIADIEALMLQTPGCRKNPDDTAQISADLKGKYGLVSCYDDIDGWTQTVLVPRAVSPSQQLRYGSIVDHKLLRARLVDHYMVIQFDTQVQYLDLLKQDKDSQGKDVGFALSGFVADRNLSRFEDMGIFKDALKNYGAVKEDDELLAKIPALIAKAVGSKRYRLHASKIKDSWLITVTSDGSVFQVWPERKNP